MVFKPESRAFQNGALLYMNHDIAQYLGPATKPEIYWLHICDATRNPVKDLDISNVLVIAIGYQEVLKAKYDYAIEEEDYKSVCLVSTRFRTVTTETGRLLTVDFTPLRQPRLGYATQTKVSHERVDMIAVAMI